jgi:S1-C subfamily serine protease
MDRVKQAVALVEGKYGHGSGFLVLPDVVVTNSHVVLCDMIEDVTVRFATDGVLDEKRVKVKLLCEDKARDLAILRLEQPQTRPTLPIAKEFKLAGKPEVFVVGSPSQGEPGVALGNVVESARCDEEVVLFDAKPFYRLTYAAGRGDVRIGKGNSGGPAVNGRGEVIGVLTRAAFRRDGRPDGKAYCIPATSVRSAMEAIGDAATWAAKIDAPTAHHARDIAVISVYANASIAYLLIDVRAEVPRAVRAWDGIDLRELHKLNKDLVEVFKSADKRFREMAQPAMKVALAGKELTAEQRNQLTAMNKDLKELREIASKQRFSSYEYRWATACDERCQKAFDKFCKDSGMSDEFVQLMVTGALQEAGIDVK